jgi:predicted phage terminase large subunit-like protein
MINAPEITLKKVEDFLREVSYEIDPTYVPSDFAIEFIEFIKLVNGSEGEENKSPVLHYNMLDNVITGTRTANMCHRGSAKTTLLAEYLFLYIGVYGELPGFGKVDLALYVSDSIENGVKNCRKNLEHRYDKSDFLKHFIPEARFTDIRWEFRNRDGNIFIIKGYGAKTGVRGAKELGKRPVLAVLDDLVSDEDARSATVIASIEDTVYKAVTYALHPTKNKIIWSGTPFNAKDPLYKAVESGAWKVNVFPVCEEFPCEEKDFRGSWPERFTYASVLESYNIALKSGKIDGFNQEMMLRIMSDEDRLIQNTDIQWYSRPTLMANRGKFNFYITTDFATSAKSAADFSVISVWALNHNGNWYWADGICKKQTMDKNVDDLFRLCQAWKPQSVGIELSGQQGGFIPWINEQMMVRNIYFTLASEGNKGAPGIRPNTDKMTRFNLVVPWFKQHKMFFPTELKYGPEMIQCMDELTNMSQKGTKSKHDDFTDTISMLAFMSSWKPSAEQEVHYNSETNIWDFDDEPLPDRMSSYIV